MKENKAKKIMNDLQEDYNLVATSFASSRDRMWPELEFLFKQAKKGESVLDLGCGNGRFSEYLKETKYVGVDFSSGMIREAKKRFPGKQFLTSSVLDLPFKESFFDKIYSIAVIHQIPSHKYRIKMLKEAKRILKKSGRVFFTAWKMDKETKEKCQILSPQGKDVFLKRKRYYYLFDEGELSDIFREAGFFVEKEGVIGEEKKCNFYIIANK